MFSFEIFSNMIGPWHKMAAAAAAKLLQSCSTLCDPIDSSPPGSPAPGILQARTLEWVAISFSSVWKWKVKVKSLSVRLLVTPWTAAYQAPPSMGFSRQEYWSGVPLPSPDVRWHPPLKAFAKRKTSANFPGSPVAKTRTPNAGGPSSIPGGELDPMCCIREFTRHN